jgi:hypothetical protein
MAANLWGDLLGSSADLTADDQRWLSPLPLWTGILTGPIMFAFKLTATYALVKWTCLTDRQAVLHLISLASLLLVFAAAWLSWEALQHTTGNLDPDAGTPEARARFMALLGLGSSVFFSLAIITNAYPEWVLDACH